ncbi:D-cysteine desulfhydrase family protein [Bythopirellula polymerisocia]|uniref:D-cysteine desulfhydrase n=1 Tax=Bythopirellula polymerisocia TaxID=2528003 RepID=A0A5C6CM39_9BACT|nr:D-cysteine desulfhydrase family protein [Bythopirellula polymerisocia]TWU24524.1 D-cysteine desulfhydrase [Bythopirellula polymerisocia]
MVEIDMMLHAQEPDRLRLAQLPTPVVELKQLSRHAGVPRILMKRDDLSGLELSGNKIRKLEYVVEDALAQGADTLVTHGGFQSNHCRATAAVGARLGLKVRLILRSEDPMPEADGNLFLDRLFGAECSFHPPKEYQSQLDNLVETTLDAERTAGRTPYFFPVGASVPLGCWGYIRCFAELAEQLGRDSPVDLYVATSSGGTQVGLMLGRALLDCHNWSVRGVPVSDSVDYFRTSLRELERQTVAEFKLNVPIDQMPIELVDGFIGEGYAIPYPDAVESIHLLGRSEGIVLDPSYTSKSMTGMLSELAQRGSSRLPVFLHTGGSFGLFARRDLLS